MKKIVISMMVILFIALGVWAVFYQFDKSTTPNETFETTKAFKTKIEKKSVATGEIVPKEKIDIKPNISGIIKTIYVEAGDKVQKGDKIAEIKVIPNISNLSNLKSRINSSKIDLENQRKNFNRQKMLYNDGVISKADYDQSYAVYSNSKENLRIANEQYQISKTGTSRQFSNTANTTIRATVNGMVLDVPIKEGFQVIEANSFNSGTTIAILADITKMEFEGKIDESEIGKLHENMPLTITVGALPEVVLTGELYHIAPQGVEEKGIVQFEIKSTVNLIDSVFIRAGYSANAEFITGGKTDVLAINEAHLQYNEKGEPYVEVKDIKEASGYRKETLKLGISDGENIQILEGITENDQIKIWNNDLDDSTKKKN